MDTFGEKFWMALPNDSMKDYVMCMVCESKIGDEIVYEWCRDICTLKIDQFDLCNPHEIPNLLRQGIYQIGLVGEDILVEQNADLWRIASYVISETKLVLIAGRECERKGWQRKGASCIANRLESTCSWRYLMSGSMEGGSKRMRE